MTPLRWGHINKMLRSSMHLLVNEVNLYNQVTASLAGTLHSHQDRETVTLCIYYKKSHKKWKISQTHTYAMDKPRCGFMSMSWNVSK